MAVTEFTFFSKHIPNTLPVIKEGIRVKIMKSKPLRLIIKVNKIEEI